MKKRPTRKKLIEALNIIVQYSSIHPITYVRFSMVNKYGVEDIDSRFYALNMDDLLSTLMDKSLTCRIAGGSGRGVHVKPRPARLLLASSLARLHNEH